MLQGSSSKQPIFHETAVNADHPILIYGERFNDFHKAI